MSDRWTAETEELVREHAGVYQVNAEAILTALADAGLLLPPGGETRQEWGVIEQGPKGLGSLACTSRERAEQFLKNTSITPIDERQLASRSRTDWYDGSRHYGPWVAVSET